MVQIVYHSEGPTSPPGQTGGFETAAGDGEIHCYQLPDQYSAMATPVGLLVLLFEAIYCLILGGHP